MIPGLLENKDLLASTQLHSSGEAFAKSILRFEQSRDLFAQLGDTAEAEIAETWAAQFLPDVSRIADGRSRLAALIARSEKNKFQVLVATGHYWLGISAHLQDDVSEAHRHYKAALSVAESSNNSFEIQHAQESLTSSYSDLAELEPALFFAGKMISDRGSYCEQPYQYWRNKGTLVDLSLKLKLFSTALAFANEGLTVMQALSQDSGRINEARGQLISVAAATEDFDVALKYANDSLRSMGSREHNAEDTRMTADIYRVRASVSSKMKNCNDALNDYNEALDLYRKLPEITNNLYQTHKGKLFCLLQLDRREEFSAELKTVLELSERYRATIREDDSRQAFFASEQDVYDAATTNSLNQHDARSAFDFIEASKSRSLLDFVKSKKTIVEVERSFGPVTQPLSLTEIQARLPEQVEVIQYAVLPDRLAIWVFSKTHFDLIEKPISAAELETKIDAYRASIIGKASAVDLNQSGRALYDLLIPSGLDNGKQLCIISDTSLHQLAFASLVAPSGKYLIQDFALSYAPSASVLVLASETAQRKETVTQERVLSIGNPDFDREENPNLADLRSAEVEARTVAGVYRTPVLLLGGDATSEKFLSTFGNVEVIHFAGHFVANRQSPGDSKLLFAGGELRSNQLSAYKLPKAKLVVLSACETAFERYNKSEGAIGIARTLLALGAPLVVASQWQVDSEPTKDLMVAFHHNRKQNGMTSAESLRRAQLEILSRDETKAPFFWSAFALFGGYANY